MGCVVAAVAAGVVMNRSKEPEAPSPSQRRQGAEESSAPTAVEEGDRLATGSVPIAEVERTTKHDQASVLLGWGSGPRNIGRSREHEEGHAWTPFRLAVDAKGSTYFLDPANERVLHVLPDGGTSDVRLPKGEALDIDTTEDGLAMLSRDGSDGRVTLTDTRGRERGTISLPQELADGAHGVVVSGKDVYVETRSGEYHRVGDVSGGAAPTPTLAPGLPTRDGKAFVTAILPSPEATEVHVFVVDRATGTQRWSRLVRPSLAVEGITMADSDASGGVYLIVTGPPRTGADRYMAELLCLDAERGDVIGSVALPVEVGPESIADGKALDGGGVVFSVTSKAGLRVEQADCR